jgi:TolA-binding protein
VSVIEFHPDDLLDRELQGTLSDADRLRLAAHLERCAVCRFERQLRFDFEQELGPSQPASDLHPVVSDVLRAAGVKPLTAPPQVGSAAPSRLRWVAAGLVVCALFGTVAAAAQLGLTETMYEWLRGGRSAPAGVRAKDGSAPRGAPLAPHSERAQPSAIAVSQTSAESKGPSQEAAAAPVTMAPSPRAFEPRRLSLRERSPALEPTTAQYATPVEADRAHEQEVTARGKASASADATTLFELASRARRRGASEDASALYQELQARFPRSPEARLSVALLARLQLDRGQLAAALAGFERYLDIAHGALREEAMVGRARTLERLGREGDAEHAWRDLLEAYPQSAAAATARRRLGQSPP